MRHSRYPKGLSMKRSWASKFGSIFYSLKELSFTASNSAAFKSRASCNSLFYFFLRVFSSVTHFMSSKCKNLIFSFLQANIESESKSPPEMTFNIDFRLVPNQFEFFSPSLCQILFVPPTYNHFYALPPDYTV